METNDIDFVLVTELSRTDSSPTSKEKRITFENNLIEEGLILEHVQLQKTNLKFTKIHAPLVVLKPYAEILKLRMPMRTDIPQFEALRTQDAPASKQNSMLEKLNKFFELDSKFCSVKADGFYATYSRDREFLFDQSEPESFFSSGTRSLIVDYILRRQRYSPNPEDEFAFGIERLLKDNVYSAAYPVHAGDLKSNHPDTIRTFLYTEWASMSKFYKYQPLDEIKDYLGVKVGLYFAWLGYYTRMLIPASILGLLCFIYGLATVSTNKHTEDICNSQLDAPMCPLCNNHCGYWNLGDTCFYARLTYLFDNDATIAFSVLMSFWTVIFLEFWKRTRAEIRHRWDLSGFDVNDEHPRPEYLARLKNVEKKRVNLITNIPEPSLSFWKRKLPNTVFSLSMVLLLICLALSAVIAVVIYRVSVRVVVMSRWGSKGDSGHGWGLLIVNSTAVILNLCFIFLFNWLYSFVALYLTEIELQRTQTEFDESLTLKMYLLQFINFYSSIFYIAFFKGRFGGSPHGYRYFLGYRQEECGPSGCMTDLCIQLAVIMVGKQALNGILEMTSPFLIRMWKYYVTSKKSQVERNALEGAEWSSDYLLLGWDSRTLFSEYLEMVIQFGFITIFVAAFPLAPLFALVNNVFEMRLDAKKLLKYYRRPVCHRVASIGIWYSILDSIGKLGVISNAFIIAFTSSFIPKLVYRLEHGSLLGFLNQSLHEFNTSHFLPESRPAVMSNESVPTCRFMSYERVSTLENEKLDFYWKVLLARLVFVVIFQNVVSFCGIVLEWIIPDVPHAIQTRIRQESYVANDIVIRHEHLIGKRQHFSEGMTFRSAGHSSRSTLQEQPEDWIELVL